MLQVAPLEVNFLSQISFIYNPLSSSLLTSLHPQRLPVTAPHSVEPVGMYFSFGCHCAHGVHVQVIEAIQVALADSAVQREGKNQEQYVFPGLPDRAPHHLSLSPVKIQ
jgi:hypothetical protein